MFALFLATNISTQSTNISVLMDVGKVNLYRRMAPYQIGLAIGNVVKKIGLPAAKIYFGFIYKYARWGRMEFIIDGWLNNPYAVRGPLFPKKKGSTKKSKVQHKRKSMPPYAGRRSSRGSRMLRSAYGGAGAWLGRGRARGRDRRNRYVGIIARNAGYHRTGGYYSEGGHGAGELKFHDVALNMATIDAAGEVSASLNIIAQDNTESGRDGRHCTIRSIWLKLHMFVVPQTGVTTATTHDTIRLMVIQDKQCNGAVPTVTIVLEDAKWDSFMNLENRNRFRILYDKYTSFNPVAASGDGTTQDTFFAAKHFNIYKKVNIPLHFSGTTGAVTECRSNNLFLLAISENALGQINGTIRLRFTG